MLKNTKQSTRAIAFCAFCALLPAPSRAEGLESIVTSLKAKEDRLSGVSVSYVEVEEKKPGFYKFYQLETSFPPKTAQRVELLSEGLRQRRLVTRLDPLTLKPLKEHPLITDVTTPDKTTNASALSDPKMSQAKDGVETRKRIYIATPLNFSYRIDSTPVSEVLAQGAFKVEGEKALPGFGRAVTIAGIGPKGRRLKIVVAPERGWLVARTEEKSNDGETLSVYEALGAKRVGDVWFPTKGRFRFLDAKKGDELLSRSYEIDESTIDPTVRVSDSDFDVKFGPGSAVSDSDTGKYYRVDPDGNRVLTSLTESAERREAKRPIGVALVAGCGALAALGIVLVRRQRPTG